MVIKKAEMCLFTNAYLVQKNKFIAKYNENSFLISAIRRLERDLSKTGSREPGKLLFFSVATDLKSWAYAELSCPYWCDKSGQKIAPCMLYFPRVAYGSQRETNNAMEQIAAVKRELSW